MVVVQASAVVQQIPNSNKEFSLLIAEQLAKSGKSKEYMGEISQGVQSLNLVSYFCIFEYLFWKLKGSLCQNLQPFLKTYEPHMVYMRLFGPYQPFI